METPKLPTLSVPSFPTWPQNILFTSKAQWPLQNATWSLLTSYFSLIFLINGFPLGLRLAQSSFLMCPAGLLRLLAVCSRLCLNKKSFCLTSYKSYAHIYTKLSVSSNWPKRSIVNAYRATRDRFQHSSQRTGNSTFWGTITKPETDCQIIKVEKKQSKTKQKHKCGASWHRK